MTSHERAAANLRTIRDDAYGCACGATDTDTRLAFGRIEQLATDALDLLGEPQSVAPSSVAPSRPHCPYCSGPLLPYGWDTHGIRHRGAQCRRCGGQGKPLLFRPGSDIAARYWGEPR